MQKKIIQPSQIEQKSFEILSEELGERSFPPLHEKIVKRVIHTTADFDFADILNFSDGVVETIIEAIKGGSNIVTDTKMAAVGINQKALDKWGGKIVCFMDDPTVAADAKKNNVTRASVCIERAARNPCNKIYVIGNAPTALSRICNLKTFSKLGLMKFSIAAVIGVPVGFVNVIESKEDLKNSGIPYILSAGRKGGSTVAAAIVNAILYMAREM